MRRVLIALWMVAGVTAPATIALAHGPVGASPGPGDIVGGQVDEVRLVFAEVMSPDGMFIVVTDEDGAAVPQRGPARLDETGQMAWVEIRPLDDPGPYRVDYRVEGRDGVTTPGAYVFTYDPDAAPPEALEIPNPIEEEGFWNQWTALGAGILVAAAIIVWRGRKAWRRW